jgi:hypothetical protein
LNVLWDVFDYLVGNTFDTFIWNTWTLARVNIIIFVMYYFVLWVNLWTTDILCFYTSWPTIIILRIVFQSLMYNSLKMRRRLCLHIPIEITRMYTVVSDRGITHHCCPSKFYIFYKDDLVVSSGIVWFWGL